MRPRIPVPSPRAEAFTAKSQLPDEIAGAREAYQDPLLYDWEYRRRRRDVAFYRRLADEQGGPIADLGCGSGRMMLALLRAGYPVVGVDLSAAMLARAAQRVHALGARRAARALLVRADLRELPLRGQFPFIMAAFHTIQHLTTDGELLDLLRRVKRLLTPNGWFAFDVFIPRPDWLARPANRRFDHTIFRHPTTGRSLEYSASHVLDVARQALHMKFYYQPVDASGAPAGRRRIVRLCHRQLSPEMVDQLVARAGLAVLGTWAGFDGEPLDRAAPHVTEQHVYLVGPARKWKAPKSPKKPAK
jgi:SAM-dependent methyltransferase